MFHIRIHNYDIQLEQHKKWSNYNYKRSYYDNNAWEVIIDLGFWRLFINT